MKTEKADEIDRIESIDFGLVLYNDCKINDISNSLYIYIYI